MKFMALMALVAFAIGLSGCTGGGKSDSGRTTPQSTPGPAPSGGGGAASPSTAERDPKRLYCTEHDCYEDVCIFCHAELRDAGRLWCAEHARYEDRCFLCHPEIRVADRAYCEKHFLYLDECFMCRPELRDTSESQEKEAPPGSETGGGLMCTEHGVAEAECGICHPELAAGLVAGEGLKVRLASGQSAARAGMRTEQPEGLSVAEGVSCSGEIVYAQDHVVEVAAPIDGILVDVGPTLGDRVARGQRLAAIASADISETVAAAVLATQTLERERKLRAGRVTSEQELQQAEAAHRSAVQRLRAIGFSGEDLDRILENPEASVNLPLASPLSGEVVERTVTAGAFVEAGTRLFTVADLTRLWVMIDIPERALRDVRVGQDVRFATAADPELSYSGTLSWISPGLDERTRLARGRVEVANHDRRLRANVFVTATILTGAPGTSLLVPSGAVQYIGEKPFAFVQVEEDLLEARSVTLGRRLGSRTVVLAGLAPSDRVVCEGSHVAKSQFLISRLGAGCVD